MSDFFAPTVHPIRLTVELAKWIDDYYGPHRYAVQFADGSIYPEEEIPSRLPPNPKS